MVRPALNRVAAMDTDGSAVDEVTETAAGAVSTDTRPDEPGVVRPVFKRVPFVPGEEISTPDMEKSGDPVGLYRAPAGEAVVLRPFFPRSSSSTGVAQFFLSPPKRIPVVDGVRPRVAGKFIFVGEEKFYMRGVTYGPFHPEEDGCEYHTPELVERDFALMAENGINSVRTYTVPPRWLLDIAQKHGLRVMIGLPWGSTLRSWTAAGRHGTSRGGCARECVNAPAILLFCVLPSGMRFRHPSCDGTDARGSRAFSNGCTGRPRPRIPRC